MYNNICFQLTFIIIDITHYYYSSNRGAQMKDNQIILAYYNQVNEQLRFLKNLEWRAVNYTILLHVAVVTLFEKYFKKPNHIDFYLLMFSLFILLITIFSIYYTRRTLKDIKSARERERRALILFSDSKKDLKYVLNEPHKINSNKKETSKKSILIFPFRYFPNKKPLLLIVNKINKSVLKCTQIKKDRNYFTREIHLICGDIPTILPIFSIIIISTIVSILIVWK